MSERFASSALLDDMCKLMNNGNIPDVQHLVDNLMCTCELTKFTENISLADANRRETCGTRSIVLEDHKYFLRFTKTYTWDAYPPRKYKYCFSVKNFAYYKEDNQSVGYIELNENDKTYRYVPRLSPHFIEDNLV